MRPVASPPPRRWERIVGAVIALVGVGVGVLTVVALASAADPSAGGSASAPAPSSVTSTGTAGPAVSASSSVSAATPAPTATPSVASSASATPSSAPVMLPLVVLNNTNRTGLAQQAARTFEQRGWTVTSTSNFSGSILSTCAYYDPAVPGSQASAQYLMQQFPSIKRVREKFSALPAGPVVVVLTTDYTG